MKRFLIVWVLTAATLLAAFRHDWIVAVLFGIPLVWLLSRPVQAADSTSVATPAASPAVADSAELTVREMDTIVAHTGTPWEHLEFADRRLMVQALALIQMQRTEPAATFGDVEVLVWSEAHALATQLRDTMHGAGGA